MNNIKKIVTKNIIL